MLLRGEPDPQRLLFAEHQKLAQQAAKFRKQPVILRFELYRRCRLPAHLASSLIDVVSRRGEIVGPCRCGVSRPARALAFCMKKAGAAGRRAQRGGTAGKIVAVGR
jgi:hypothetical protein